MLNCSEVNSTDWSEAAGINEEFGLLKRRQSRGGNPLSILNTVLRHIFVHMIFVASVFKAIYFMFKGHFLEGNLHQ